MNLAQDYNLDKISGLNMSQACRGDYVVKPQVEKIILYAIRYLYLEIFREIKTDRGLKANKHYRF